MTSSSARLHISAATEPGSFISFSIGGCATAASWDPERFQTEIASYDYMIAANSEVSAEDPSGQESNPAGENYSGGKGRLAKSEPAAR